MHYSMRQRHHGCAVRHQWLVCAGRCDKACRAEHLAPVHDRALARIEILGRLHGASGRKIFICSGLQPGTAGEPTAGASHRGTARLVCATSQTTRRENVPEGGERLPEQRPARVHDLRCALVE